MTQHGHSRQVATRSTTVSAVMRRAAFKAGVASVAMDLPFNYDAPQESQWDYERGRLFAKGTGCQSIRQSGGTVDVAQQRQFLQLCREGVMI